MLAKVAKHPNLGLESLAFQRSLMPARIQRRALDGLIIMRKRLKRL